MLPPDLAAAAAAAAAPLRDWTELWLKEGFATYFENLGAQVRAWVLGGAARGVDFGNLGHGAGWRGGRQRGTSGQGWGYVATA